MRFRLNLSVFNRIVILLVCVCSICMAEIRPLTGLFEGVYHRDQWGIGHFHYFNVHPDLHARLAPYEGKFVRLTVTEARSEFTSGPVLMVAVGEITPMPASPLGIRLMTRPAKPVAGQPFEVVIEATNLGMDDCSLHPQTAEAIARQPSHRDVEPIDDGFYRQTIYLLEDRRRFNLTNIHVDPSRPFPWQNVFNYWCGPIRLTPGASYLWSATFPAGALTESGEVHVRIGFGVKEPGADYLTWKGFGLNEAWLDVPVNPAVGEKEPDEPGMKADKVDLRPGVDGWMSLRCHLHPINELAIKVPGTRNVKTGEVIAAKYAHTMKLYGFAEDGSEIALDAIRLPQADAQTDEHAQMVDLPPSGMVLEARFRKVSRYAPPLHRLLLTVLTDRGTDEITLADRVSDPDVSPATPFGEPFSGVALRVRPEKPIIASTGPFLFHVQAVNVSGQPVMWWAPSGGVGEHLEIAVDGQVIESSFSKAEYIFGWGQVSTIAKPVEWTFALPMPGALSKGRHVLRYAIVSGGGEYPTGNSQKIPLLDGRIVSNEVVFNID